MLKNMSLITLLAASLVACGGSDEKRCCTISSAASSSVAAVSSAAAVSSVAAVSSAPASAAASSVATSTVVSSTASDAVSSDAATSSTPASSEAASSSSAPAAKLSIDFDSDTVGTTYEGTGWNPAHVTATVVTIASVSGLPAHGSSTNALKIVVSDYNAIPLMEVSLPAGKTLSDYNVKVDAYFPRNTLGLTDSNANYYKPFLLLAGTAITSAASETNPAYQSKIDTIYDDVDTWKTYTLTVDATKGAALTGTFKIGMGLNRPGGTTDGYYFDNVRLELK